MVDKETRELEIKTINGEEVLIYHSPDHGSQIVNRYDLLNKLIGKKIVIAFGATSKEEAEWGDVGEEIMLILEDGTELYIYADGERGHCMLRINGVDPL
jgi:class 3 adenylate cyclase